MLALFYTLHKSLQDRLGLLSLLQSSLAVARWRLPTADVPLPLGSRTVPVPQLPASHSNSSQRLNPSGYLTHADSITYQLS
jgi:hypothetical protein